ncbi:MAG: flagellar hook assembly protein FlgD [Gammaproteobacteria bacterium]|nr:flagellar hook assembly protein FlgD [Gammaproteobacteria bacterium]
MAADGISKNNPLIDQLGIQQKQAEDAKKKSSLGQEDFLKLMVAQLQNQSPLKPQENGEFLGQMAQFSTVSGLQDMKSTLDSLSTSLVSNQALQASSMVGRYVRVPSDSGVLPEGEGDRFFGAVDLQQSVPDLKFEILGPAGDVVKTIGMGTQQEGSVQFAWDGIGNDGNPVPPGEYKIRASATMDGKLTSLDTEIVAPVESVTLGRAGEQMKLNISGVGARSMDQIKEILS